MRYVLKCKSMDLRGIIMERYPFRNLNTYMDYLKFDHDSIIDMFTINQLIGDENIAWVLTESEFIELDAPILIDESIKLNKNAKLGWYGRCESYKDEYGSKLNLKNYAQYIDEVYYPVFENQGYFISWSSRVESANQPFSELEEGKLYYFNFKSDDIPNIPGLTLFSDASLGASVCGETSNTINNKLNKEFNLIWFGECESEIKEYEITNENILEVYQFSTHENKHKILYYLKGNSKSTLSRLEFGNAYYIKLSSNTEITIPGAVVSDFEVKSTFAPVHPIRLRDCTNITTPTPKATPTPKQETGCCDNKNTSVEVTNGDAPYTNGITFDGGNLTGTLCWDALTPTSDLPSTYYIMLDSESSGQGLKLNISAQFTNGNVFRFVNSNGDCYEGKLEKQDPEKNVFLKISSEPTTPTPTLNLSDCCDNKDVHVSISENWTNTPITKNYLEIYKSNISGILCWNALSETPGDKKEYKVYLNWNNNAQGFMIRTSVDLSNVEFSFSQTALEKSQYGDCYSEN